MVPVIDLNYRLDLPDVDVREIVGSEDWACKYEVLQKSDQVPQPLFLILIIYALSVACQGTERREGLQTLPRGGHQISSVRRENSPIRHLRQPFSTYRFTPGILTDGYDQK